MNQTGVLLINLGTPDACDTASVKRYLTQFLNDPRVVDLSFLKRWLLVNLLIVPFRAKKTAKAYSQIWSSEDSPLLANSIKLQHKLQAAVGNHYQIEIGMRYGTPSIASALKKLSSCTKLIILPLFPQYTSAATGSAIEAVIHEIANKWNMPEIIIKPDFYHLPGFVNAFANNIKTAIGDKKIDTLLFSYHGLPERHITKSECHAVCDHLQACPPITRDNSFCYRTQCYETSRLIAAELQLSDHDYHVSFQSRLGKTPWIKPYTDLLLPQLIQQGKKNIAIVSPSFVADCLETLEEINIRTRAQWEALGGNNFIFVPCLNDSDIWVQALTNLIHAA